MSTKSIAISISKESLTLTNWGVITGGPGSGKMTTVNLLKASGYKWSLIQSGIMQHINIMHGVTYTRPASDYTVRIIPPYENISIPLADNLILWRR